VVQTSIDATLREALEATFRRQRKPSADEMARLAAALRLDREVVRVWFCNRRQKHKRAAGVGGGATPGPAPDSVSDETVSSCTADPAAAAAVTFNPGEDLPSCNMAAAVTCQRQLPVDLHQLYTGAPMTSYQPGKDRAAGYQVIIDEETFLIIFTHHVICQHKTA